MIGQRLVTPVLVVLLGVTVGMSLFGCTGRRHQDRFRWQEFIDSSIRYVESSTDPVYFDVRGVMPFGWETFYVFPPYTPIEDVEKALGFGWGTAKKTRIHERDDIVLLVFVAGRTVHEYIEQPRAKGDFSRLKPGYPYSPEEAYLEVVKEEKDGQSWFVFVEAERLD
ncbi:MAG: hypothetical protein JSW58_03700 [Candidatus Latescibacterota bacterium]|nr:MAG: hypothetical protein JSW58_03700 [Candidatus Latescibacterota bacterium]